jgi:hypothetical protein
VNEQSRLRESVNAAGASAAAAPSLSLETPFYFNELNERVNEKISAPYDLR